MQPGEWLYQIKFDGYLVCDQAEAERRIRPRFAIADFLPKRGPINWRMPSIAAISGRKIMLLIVGKKEYVCQA
jgi:hypothetical protein